MSDPHPPLQLKSTIDTAEIARLAIAVKAAFLQHNLAERERMIRFGDALTSKIVSAPKAAAICMWLSVTGLVVALVLSALGGVLYQGYRLDWAFAVFFALMIVLLPALRRFVVWVRKPWLPYWNFLARMHTSMLLKTARANAPFEAEYVVDGDTVSYFRIRQGQREPAWTRRLYGFSLAGPGFTFFFKNPTSMTPYALMLHQPSPGFDALLDRLGVQRMAPQAVVAA
jgi:hypothetical protein